ncbi:InlB B-repeat-containing protein [Candidatus Magnetominusculus dajiuhuensis]|uniref:WD40/YVTN/BNR-like repeat-containing protein n=1 Tax=Candidatus Magnetominusculus dajiuhuensis TaxID=3137712 RepID=UPI003B435299
MYYCRNFIAFLATVTALILIPIAVAVAVPPTQWLSRGIGGGGALYCPSFSPHNANELYIACDMSGLFHSTDLGASWNVVDFRQIQSFHYTLVQFTSNPSILYSLDYSSDNGTNAARPSKSTDGGVTWTPLSGWPASNRVFKVFADPNSTTRLIITTVNQMYFSSDGGNTFTLRYTDATGNGLSIGGALFDGQNIYAGTNAGLLVSGDGGSTFTISNVTGVPASEAIFSFAGAKQGTTTRLYAVTVDASKMTVTGKTDPLTSEDIYGSYRNVYTLDIGQNTWIQKVTGIASGDQPVLVSMALNDISTAYLAGRIAPVGSALAGASPVIYKTTNGGSSWQSTFLTTNNQNIYTGWTGQGGDMGGGNWWWSNTPIGFAVAPNDSGKVVYTDKGGVPHLTTDGGATWRQIYTDSTIQHPIGTSTPSKQYYRGAGLEPTLSLWLTWTDSSNLFAGFGDITAIRSKDGGNTWGFDWTGLNFNISGHNNYSTEVFHVTKHPSNGTLYASQSNGSGEIYHPVGLTDAYIDNIGGGGIRYSTDGGQSWTTLHVFGSPGYPVIWTAIDPNNTNRMYASVVNSTQGGIYASNNIQNGASSTWTRLTNPTRTEGHPYNVYVLNDGTVVATFSGRRNSTGAFTQSSGVFISGDGGGTWTDRSDPGMLYYTKGMAIDPNDSTQNTWYVSTVTSWGSKSIQGGLFKTTNRGQTWNKIFSANSVESCTVNPHNPNEIYLATSTSGLWYSSNATDNTPAFTQVSSYPFRNPSGIFFNPYNQNEIWVLSNGNGLRVGQTSSSYTLSVTKTGNGTITSSPQGISCGSTCSSSYTSTTSVTLTATADSSSAFSSWTGCDNTSGYQCTITMSSNRSVKTIFTSGSSDNVTAAAAINEIYNQYTSWFGSTSGDLITGTSGGVTYYVQWFTNGAALVAWTDGYIYTYYNGQWFGLGLTWQTLGKAAAAITAIYNQYASWFGSKSGGIIAGTSGGATYYAQWFTSGTALVAWTDGTMFTYYNGTWYQLGVNWR